MTATLLAPRSVTTKSHDATISALRTFNALFPQSEPVQHESRALPLQRISATLARVNEPVQTQRNVGGGLMRASVIRAPRNTATMQSFHQAVRTHDKSSLSPIDRDHLGERLRAMYGQLREEPLPPRLQDLVQQLAQTSPE
jgi:hypothetical protein